MSPQEVGAVISGVGVLLTAAGGFTWRVVAIIRQDQKDREKERRYREAREELLFKRIEITEEKLHEVAMETGVTINGMYKLRMEMNQREWDRLIDRGPT